MQASQPQGFISYSHADRKSAQEIYKSLNSFGLEVWWDQGIRPASDWREEISQALRDASYLVGLVSPNSIRSKEVKMEIHWALDADVPVILLLVREVPIRDMPYRISGIQYIDYTKDKAAAIRRLLTEIKPILEGRHHHVPVALLSPDHTSQVDLQEWFPSERNEMLRRVSDVWIRGCLLPLKSDTSSIAVPFHVVPDETLKPVEIKEPEDGQSIGSYFQSSSNTVLILGAAGSGKTVALLELARRLIADAFADVTKPIPIVFNVSSFESEKSFKRWLLDEADDMYGAPTALMRALLKNYEMHLLLDGIDEMPATHRSDFLKTLNLFRVKHRRIRVSACSRYDEYKVIGVKLDIPLAVALDPISQPSIQNAFPLLSVGAIRRLCDAEPWLQELMANPLILALSKIAYRGVPIEQILLPRSGCNEAGRRAHIFEAYTLKCLEGFPAFPIGKNALLQVLTKLATRMVASQKTIFYIDSLQGVGNQISEVDVLYCFMWRWVVGLFGGGVIFAHYALYRHVFPHRMAWHKALFEILILMLSLHGFLASVWIVTRERGNSAWYLKVRGYLAAVALGVGASFSLLFISLDPWSFAESRTEYSRAAVAIIFSSVMCANLVRRFGGSSFGLYSAATAACATLLLICLKSTEFAGDSLLALVALVVFAALMGLLFSLFTDEIKMNERFGWRWNWRTFFLMLPFGGLLGRGGWPRWAVSTSILNLIGWCCIGGMLFGFRRSERLSSRTIVGIAVWRTFRNAMTLAVLLCLAANIFLLYVTLSGQTLGSGFGEVSSFNFIHATILCASIGFVLGGGDVLAKYMVARILACLFSGIPIKIRKYLDAGVDCSLLRRVGGGYLFRHRTVMEYFAHEASRLVP